MRVNLVNAGNPASDFAQDAVKLVRVFPLHVLDDVGQVVSVDAQAPLGANQRKAAGGVGGEIAQVPAFDELAEGRNSRVLRQCTKGCNAEPAVVLELDQFSIEVFYSVGCSPFIPDHPFIEVSDHPFNVDPFHHRHHLFVALVHLPAILVQTPLLSIKKARKGSICSMLNRSVGKKVLEQNMRPAGFILC